MQAIPDQKLSIMQLMSALLTAMRAMLSQDLSWCKFAAIGMLQDLRPSLFAIHAFNVELALIPDVVSQPTLAQIRYQWWRESINSLKGPNSVNHPVIQALSQVSCRHQQEFWKIAWKRIGSHFIWLTYIHASRPFVSVESLFMVASTYCWVAFFH